MAQFRPSALLFVFLAFFKLIPQTSAGIIAGWNFENQWAPVGQNATVGATSGSWLGSSTAIDAHAGTGVTIVDSDNLGFGGLSGDTLAGSTVTIRLYPPSPVSGAFSVSLIASVAGNGNQGLDCAWHYSIDGGSPQSLTPSGQLAYTGSPTAFLPYNNYLSIPSANPVTSLVLVGTLGSTTGTSTVNFDNVAVDMTPVPEPIHYALVVFAALFLGATFGQRTLKRAASPTPSGSVSSAGPAGNRDHGTSPW